MSFVKSVRALVHSGELVRVDRPAEPGTVLFGVVAPDRRAALFAFVRVHTSARYGSAPVVFAGLDPGVRYRIERIHRTGDMSALHVQAVAQPPAVVVVQGSLLMHAGLPGPSLGPEQAVIYQLSEQP